MSTSSSLNPAVVRSTLSDVAVHAGVSKSTVSMVLNEHPQARRYSPATRQRVVEAAKALGYRPNFMARQLRLAQNKWLMLYLSSFRETFAAQVADAFELRAAERGYMLVVAGLKGKSGMAEFEHEGLRGHGIQAVAVVGHATEKMLPNEMVARLADEGTHCCLVNRDLDHPRVSRVVIDYVTGQREMAEHLRAQGVRELLILPGPADWMLGSQRQKAMEECAVELGWPPPAVVHTPATEVNNGYQAVAEWLGRFPAPDAVIGTTDYLAYGAMRACGDAGLRVGQDIAVVGFDDIYPSEFTMPSLTTVRLPMEEMGRASADLLIDSLESKAGPGGRVLLSAHAVFRESSRLCPSNAHPDEGQNGVAGDTDHQGQSRLIDLTRPARPTRRPE